MSEKWFELNNESFQQFLKDKGFKRLDVPGEVVYIRNHHQFPYLMVKVYTTISPSGKIRKKGSDAIRVAAVFDNGKRNFGIGKFPKVYRRVPNSIAIFYIFHRHLFSNIDIYQE